MAPGDSCAQPFGDQIAHVGPPQDIQSGRSCSCVVQSSPAGEPRGLPCRPRSSAPCRKKELSHATICHLRIDTSRLCICDRALGEQGREPRHWTCHLIIHSRISYAVTLPASQASQATPFFSMANQSRRPVPRMSPGPVSASRAGFGEPVAARTENGLASTGKSFLTQNQYACSGAVREYAVRLLQKSRWRARAPQAAQQVPRYRGWTGHW